MLGVLYISSEYSTGMIHTSLTAVPRRGRVLAAKSLVYATVTLSWVKSSASWPSSSGRR